MARLILLTTLVVLVACGAGPQDRSPHVVFYLLDTVRADALSPYGAAPETTPFLSELASQGVVFENCFAQSTWTKPSMASILTSKYASSHKVVDLSEHLDASELTVATFLSDRGWHTAAFSANPIMGGFMSGFDAGFVEFHEAIEIIRWGNAIQSASGSAAALNRVVFEWLDQPARRPVLANEQPMMLYLHSVDAHEEYEPAAEFLERFADPTALEAHRRDRKSLLEHSKQRFSNLDLHRTQKHFDAIGLDPGPFMAYSRQLYNADVAANDHELRRLFERLEGDGLLDNTLVVITSDHGDEFMEHGGTSHGYSLYNDLIRVPLILWGPGLVPAGVRVEQPVQSIDIVPTLVDVLGLEMPEAFEGRSLEPLMRSGGAPEPDPPAVFSEKHPPVDAPHFAGGTAVTVIRWPWKFTLNAVNPAGRELPKRELYHLIEDPGETRNRIDDEPERAAQLETEIEEYMRLRLRSKSRPERIDRSDIDTGTRELLRELGYGE